MHGPMTPLECRISRVVSVNEESNAMRGDNPWPIAEVLLIFLCVVRGAEGVIEFGPGKGHRLDGGGENGESEKNLKI